MRSVPAGQVTAGTVRTVQAGPVTGLIAQVLLVSAFAASVGLSGAGWVVGISCGVVTMAALALGIPRYGSDRLGPGDWVTLARATLAVGVAALTADSFDRPAQVTLLVTLATVALVLDRVDGWVVRRTGTASSLGAQFDGEVDAFLIGVLSVYVARSAGWWVLAIGAARYAFLAAGWLLPWMRAQLPPRYWRKVVAATQGIVLTIAAAGVVPPAPTRVAVLAALALLSESFGRDIAWLWIHRHATERPVAAERRAQTRTRASKPRLRAHDPRSPDRVGRPRRSESARSSHTRRVPESAARGPGRHRPGPRPADGRSTPPGLRHRGRLSGCW